MAVYFVLVGFLGMLFFLSGKEQLPEEMKTSWFQTPFYKGGYYLAVKKERVVCGAEKRKGRKREGEGKKETRKKETEKLANVLMILFLGLGISLAAEGSETRGGILKEGYGVIRPEKGEGNKLQELQVEVEGISETEMVEVLVEERRYTCEEKQEFLKKAMEQMDGVILGDNSSAEEVRGRVELPVQMMEGEVSVMWMQEPEGLLKEDGSLIEDLPEEGTPVKLTARLACEDQEAVYETTLKLYPPERSREEKLLFSLEKQVKEENEKSIQEEMLKLPSEVEGYSVVWMEPESSVTGICMTVTILAAFAVYIGKEREFRQEKVRRQRQMAIDYPGLLFKLSMLLNAGLTMQNAFTKIAMEYRDRKSGKVRYAYEEMLTSCYEMKSGISEAKAYEDFGKRCGENRYMKLGATLSGNLQKGSQGLTKLLQEEAMAAMDERKQLAKKLGEEAGTKLLMPMMLMLVVVLVILMVPAVLAF